MPDSIGAGDLQAIVDVLDQLSQELTDGPGVEQLVRVYKQMTDVTAMTKRVNEQVTALMKEGLEGQARVVDGEQWKVKDNWEPTFDHPELARRVIQRLAVDPNTGEIMASDEALDLATSALRAFITIYLSNSSSAKRTALKSLLDIDDPIGSKVAKWRKTGKKIVAKPWEEP
jgi:hypothetical protein